MLGFLEKLTLTPESVGADDVRVVRVAGVSDEDMRDAIYICMAFNLMNRVADALGFDVPPSFVKGEEARLKRRHKI